MRAKQTRNGQRLAVRAAAANVATELPPGAARTLHRLYTNFRVAGSFGSVAALRDAAAKENLRLTHRQVAEFLRSEPAYGIHRQQRLHYPRRRVISFDINWLWELDVAFMVRFAPHNAGYAYLLVKIDVLSKQLAVEPMRTKTTEETVAALQRICDRVGATPARIACDAGGEFKSDVLLTWAAQRRIRVYFVTQSAHGAANVERVIRTLKARLYRYLTHVNWRRAGNKARQRYVHVLQQIVNAYNHSRHRSIGMTPADVNEANMKTVRARLFPHDEARFAKSVVHRYAVGDMVRRAEHRGGFHRGFLPQFSAQVFRVHQQRKTFPPTYLLAKLGGTVLTGVFNEAELLPVTFDAEQMAAGRGAQLNERGLEQESAEELPQHEEDDEEEEFA